MDKNTKTKITVEFNSDKVTALRMYLSGKGMDLEVELEKTLQTMYEKHVPTQVRDFILMKEETAEHNVKVSKNKFLKPKNESGDVAGFVGG